LRAAPENGVTHRRSHPRHTALTVSKNWVEKEIPMSLRQDALWIKQNWSPDSRKHWILDILAAHMGFRWLNYGVDRVEEYNDLLYAIRHMKPAHRLVLRDIFRMDVYGVIVQFADGRLLEVRRDMARTFTCPVDSNNWEEKPSLHDIMDVLNWIESEDLTLWQPGQWKVRDDQVIP
jgi:hypothetical protein